MPKRSSNADVIEAFDLDPGRKLTQKFEVVSFLGRGWEGEVYRIRECSTGIERAAKIFYPQRNPDNKVSDRYARRLHYLRECPALIQYHTQERVVFKRIPVTVLISEYVDGRLLPEFLRGFRGRRLTYFQGIHLLHALVEALESIHHLGEYHGDLHAENVMVRRFGLSFDLKLLDLFYRGPARRVGREDDLCDAVRIFYDALGGRKTYAKHPPQIKEICCGLKRSLILRRFGSASGLRWHLETTAWD